MIPRRVQIALLIAFLLHGFFILTARYRLSYDAYTHMLFANHYAENWFSLWEPRWYTGFTVVSYPPLIHQLTALFIPILGFDGAVAYVLWMVTSLYPLGIYAFSRVFTGKSSAAYAALASAILLPLFVVAHIFGQLPFLASTLIALFGAASLNKYLHEGGIHNLLLTVSLLTTSIASHHATLMIHPFLTFAVLINNMANRGAFQSLKRELSTTSVSLWFNLFRRLVIFASITVLTSSIVLWPFWEWGMQQTLQTPIDHPSRHNFLVDPLAPAIFFWPLYGPLVLIIPFLFQRWPVRFLGLIASFAILLVLGLGGTTSLPQLFFGAAWEWLTYDRFAFWACLTLTPFFGIVFLQLKRRWRNRFISKPVSFELLKNFFSAVTFSIFAVTALGAWFTPLVFPIQPEPINMRPIINFLASEDRPHWRYVTLGFGDQFAYLNLLTKATTIDGSYHTARTLPELRESGIGQIDTVYWALKGIPAIIPLLEKSGEYGVRWAFVNPDTLQTTNLRWGVIHRSPFIPALEKLGWIKLRTLTNGIQIWENPQATFPKPLKMPSTPAIKSFSWGVFPMFAFVTTAALGALRLWPVQAEKVLQGIYAFIVGLIPLSLCFWYYRTIAEFPHERVYFIYDHALFFLTDALILSAVILWLSVKIVQPIKLRIRNYYELSLSDKLAAFLSDFHRPLFTLFLLSSISILWSADWRTSLFITLHFWLLFLFILSLQDWRDAWKPIMLGSCAALSIQIIASFVEFATQSTAFLRPLHSNWPGPFDPSVRGVSVVQFADGLRVLRAYGTTPHPNILGGFALFSLLGPISLFLVNKKPNYVALILLSLGIIVIGLTFSRSAWLGLIVVFGFLILKSNHFNRKLLFLLIASSLLAFLLTLYPLRDLVFTRVSGSPIETEQLSRNGRSWLSQQGFDTLRQNPLTGVGIGAFVISLSNHALEGAPIEPVHNILLLAGTELGIVGMLLMLIFFLSIAWNMIKARSPKSILAGAILAGLGIIGLFDHYLWSLAPGRAMFALALGLWAGSIKDHAA